MIAFPQQLRKGVQYPISLLDHPGLAEIPATVRSQDVMSQMIIPSYKQQWTFLGVATTSWD